LVNYIFSSYSIRALMGTSYCSITEVRTTRWAKIFIIVIIKVTHFVAHVRVSLIRTSWIQFLHELCVLLITQVLLNVRLVCWLTWLRSRCTRVCLITTFINIVVTLITSIIHAVFFVWIFTQLWIISIINVISVYWLVICSSGFLRSIILLLWI